MTGRASSIARALVAILVISAYALLAHRFSTTQNAAFMVLPVALAPLLMALLLRARQWALLLCAAVVAAVWLPNLRELLTHNLAWVYFAQDSALNIALCLLFGRTLRQGRVPLCSRIACALHAHPSAHLLRYTRRVTVAWTIFFAAVVLLSTLLFFFAERMVWSSFANLLYWPLLIAMFALEYVARQFALPPAERAGFLATVGAFRHLAVLDSASRGAR